MTPVTTVASRFLLASVVVGCGLACRSGDAGSSQFAPPEASAVNASASGTRATRTQDQVAQAPIADGQLHAEIGQPAPDFDLTDLEGRRQKLSSYRGKMVVLEWFNPDCAAVVYAYGEGELREMKARHASTGIVWLSINSTAPGEPGAEIELNQQFAAAHHLDLPILMDPTGVVGRSYGARTTPQMFLVNERGVLVYAGALDNAPRGRVQALATKTNYVENAIADLRSGHGVTQTSTRPYGCEIKYARARTGP
jgi:peroxiredoxin